MLAVTVTPEVDAVTVGVVAMGGAVLDVVRCPTERVPTPADTVAIAAEEVHRIRSTIGPGRSITALGVAVPGLVHGPESTVQLAPNLDWHDVEIGQALSAATQLPVYAANDANAGAIAEHLFGNHRDGGGARSEAVRRIAPAVFNTAVHVPTPAEYVALGAARQAAWVLSGNESPPPWSVGVTTAYDAAATPQVLEQYHRARQLPLR